MIVFPYSCLTLPVYSSFASVIGFVQKLQMSPNGVAITSDSQISQWYDDLNPYPITCPFQKVVIMG